MFKSKTITSLLTSVFGAIFAVVSIYSPWAQFSLVSETPYSGIQLDTFFVKNVGYNLWTNAVYLSAMFALLSVLGTVLSISKLEQLKARTARSLLLLASSVCVSIPIIRLLVAFGFALNFPQSFLYGFWLLVTSFVLLLISWGISVWEIKQTPGKYDVICDVTNKLIDEGKGPVSVLELAEKCHTEVASLREMLSHLSVKDRLRSVYITEDKVISKTWLRERLKETLE